MLILKLKQAQCALADERLDEAFDLLNSDQIKQQHKAQKLISQLAQALINRAQNHLNAARLAQAEADCNKASSLAGNQAQIAQIRTDLCKQREQIHYQNQQQQVQVALAQKNFDNGMLSVGQDILDLTQNKNQDAHILMHQVNAKRLEIKSIITRIEQAISMDNLELCLDIIAEIEPKTIRSNTTLTKLHTEINHKLVLTVQAHFKEARLDLACLLLKRMVNTDELPSQVQQIHQALNNCAKAQQYISQGHPDQACEILQKLKLMYPNTKWLNTAIDQANLARENLNKLKVGPLALIDPDLNIPVAEPQNTTIKKARQIKPNNLNTQKTIQNNLVSLEKFVLQVDGVGSFLVLTQNQVTAGPISCSAGNDLDLIMNPHLPRVNITRDDEDYFLTSKKPVLVSDTRLNHKLLVDGDRISLSDKCRIKFNLPNAASTTATLVISGAKMTRPDINYVILMDQNILIGPSCNNHIRTSALSENLVLTRENNRIFCRNAKQIMINKKQASANSHLPVNTPVNIDNISLVFAQYSD